MKIKNILKIRGKNFSDKNIAEKIFIGIMLFVFAAAVLHAPITVGLRTLFPEYDLLIKSWKEMLMLIGGFAALYILVKSKNIKILTDPIIIAIVAYVSLHFLCVIFLYQGLNATAAGLIIDLRYVVFFLMMYALISIYPQYKRYFIKAAVVGALIVVIFSILQVFILPYDVLKYLGYSKYTIIPYLVIDQNYDFIRINSTLRGPNPLGAYAVIVLALISVAYLKNKVKKKYIPLAISVVILVGGLVSVWASYSRSALVAAVVAVSIVTIVVFYKKISKKIWIIIGIVIIVLSIGAYAVKDSKFVSNVLLHENPANMESGGSNQGHIRSLDEGVDRLVRQPFGAGVGSTGSASVYTDHPLIIENQYLSIAHEAGWLGLILFLYIYLSILYRLWLLRSNWLALGVFASGVGLAIIGLLLPVWTDDTVSIIWWGLAAIALFPNIKDYN